MKLLNKMKTGPIVIPEDLSEELSKSEALDAFQRRPKHSQQRDIRWIERAETTAQRADRVRHVVAMVVRDAQYERSRHTGWVGPTRTT
ncbi:MAG: YdeI/OmpD-associated family protein [Spirochaetales bacterium]